jgi:hypothetical protein
MNIISRIYYSFLILSGKKSVIGRKVKVKLYGKDGKNIVTIAKVDTGAYTTSIDKSLALELGYQSLVDLKESEELKKFIDKPIEEIKGNIIGIQNIAYNEFKSKYPELSAIKIVISSHGVSIRPEFNIRIRFGGQDIITSCNITSRSSMKYTCLLGRKALKSILVDTKSSI